MLNNIRVRFVLPAAAMIGALALAASAQAKHHMTPPVGTPPSMMGPVVYVTSQELYYDTIVLASLPFEGPFQLLEMAGVTGERTGRKRPGSEAVGTGKRQGRTPRLTCLP